MSDISYIEASTEPKLLEVMIKVLLARLGGQVLLTQEELRASGDYTGVRIALNPDPTVSEMCTLTLLTDEAQNDRPSDAQHDGPSDGACV